MLETRPTLIALAVVAAAAAGSRASNVLQDCWIHCTRTLFSFLEHAYKTQALLKAELQENTWLLSDEDVSAPHAHVCVFTCTHMRVPRVHTCVFTCAHMCTHFQLDTCLFQENTCLLSDEYLCVSVFLRAHKCVCSRVQYTCVRSLVHMLVLTCSHLYTYMCVHVCTHVCSYQTRAQMCVHVSNWTRVCVSKNIRLLSDERTNVCSGCTFM